MQYATIICEKKDGIARITLNRPEVLNALNAQLFIELKEALEDIASDDTVGVVVLTGRGRAFSAGADVKEMNTGNQDRSPNRRWLHFEVNEAIENLDKPVIAAINGYCLTGALETVTACDIIVAAENAIFGDTHARWGLTPGGGMTQRLPRRIGAYKAKEMIFTCETLTAREAEQIGLVNKVVAPEELDKAVDELARKILANSQASIRIQKSLINRGLRLDYASGLELERAESPVQTRDAESRLRSFGGRNKD